MAALSVGFRRGAGSVRAGPERAAPSYSPGVSQERGEVLWSPPSDAVERTRMGDFLRWAGPRAGRDFAGYRELWQWSVDDIEGFWEAFVAWAGVPWAAPPERALAGGDRSMPGSRWFPAATLNYAMAALAHAERAPDAPAVVAVSQTRPRVELTWAALADAVARCRAGLAAAGVGRGDVVAAYAPNIPETLVAFLAAAGLGAVWASCAPEFGTTAVVDRLSQIGPKALFVVDGYRYGAKEVDRGAEVSAVLDALPSVQTIVPIRYLGTGDDGWSPLLAAAPPAPSCEAVPGDHPLYVLFSSGTTGLPKPIVHGHGGITVEHLKVLALHHDLGPGDRFAWFTTTGWMMWNYLVSGLLVGATVVLFDGDPGSPDLSVLWRMAGDEGLDVLGVSAPFLMACAKAGLVPRTLAGLDGLRQVGSTGAPLPADGFRWVHEAVGRHVQLASISGGTDVCTAFVGPSPLLPVRAGEISGPLLGCDVRAVGPGGRPCPPGVAGELVVAAPMPSMPVRLWGDPDGSRLRASYYEDHPGAWSHGDWVTVFEDGACVISGRADATLNRGGVRMGTAEFYRVVEALPEVADSLVVHLDGDDDRLLLFVALAPDAALDEGLRGRIAAALRAELSPRHVPDLIEAVPAVPRTLSGKKLEIPVKRILRGAPAASAASAGSLADPSAIGWYEAYARALAAG
jgi:acetoacetyl-CoA synthetase